MTIGRAAPLRQDSRAPRLQPYPRACAPGYSRRVFQATKAPLDGLRMPVRSARPA